MSNVKFTIVDEKETKWGQVGRRMEHGHLYESLKQLPAGSAIKLALPPDRRMSAFRATIVAGCLRQNILVNTTVDTDGFLYVRRRPPSTNGADHHE